MESSNKRKLFIGGLSLQTTTGGLHQYFSRFGQVTDSIVKRNRDTGRSRGFDFVTFHDDAAVESVFINPHHQLDGRVLDIKRSDTTARPKVIMGTNTHRVFLGGLPCDVTETELCSIFDKYGKVLEAVIVIKDDGRKKGFVFISFEKNESVERLISKRFGKIRGKRVEIRRAEPRDSNRLLMEPFVKSELDKLQNSHLALDKDLMSFTFCDDTDADNSDRIPS